jgi:hypothetical protein
MIKELEDMLWVIFNDFDDLLEPNTVNILMEHLNG